MTKKENLGYSKYWSRHCQLYSLVLGVKNHFSKSKINLVQHVDVLDETPKTCIDVWHFGTIIVFTLHKNL
jgi:hypothetical protein